MSQENTKQVIYLAIASLITGIFFYIYLKGSQPRVDKQVIEQVQNPIDAYGGLKFLGGFILVLLSVIGYFIVYYFKQQSDTNKELRVEITGSNDKLTQAITISNNKLTFSIDELTSQIDKLSQWKTDFEKMCEIRQTTCEKLYGLKTKKK
jgi:hypothetical protein